MKFLAIPLMAAILALGFGAPPAQADRNTIRDLADQAVLVHRITKSACMLFVGAETPVHAQDVIASSEMLTTLSVWLAMDPDASEPMLTELETYTRSARQIAAGDRHTVPVTLLLLGNPSLAARYRERWQSAPSDVEERHRASYALVQELRVASQAFQRDLCLFLTNLTPEGAGAILATDIAEFSDALVRLVEGDVETGIVPAPNIHIKITLGKVASKWKTLEPILSGAASGAPVDSRNAQLASVLGDSILANFDEISDRFLNY
ncbi:hypothetical protein [uncultured Tateyamaria sp.]|uniref:hypothetical protein n=1 Tax=uncultured Tateyamaria sp. TaxID=455651 RepID=UPI002612A64A|nr:hypothetical protein [uncultured Tateyamaria sp.]